MTQTALIERKTIENVGGEEVETWNPLGEVRCLLTPIGGGETGIVGGRVAEETTHMARFPANTEIEEPDRLTVDGITFDVTVVHKRTDEPSRVVECKESVSG